MATLLPKDQQAHWNKFVAIVDQQIRGHPSMCYDETVAFNLGTSVNASYKEYKNDFSTMAKGPGMHKTTALLEFLITIKGHRSVTAAVQDFTESLKDEPAAKMMLETIKEQFLVPQGGINNMNTNTRNEATIAKTEKDDIFQSIVKTVFDFANAEIGEGKAYDVILSKALKVAGQYENWMQSGNYNMEIWFKIKEIMKLWRDRLEHHNELEEQLIITLQSNQEDLSCQGLILKLRKAKGDCTTDLQLDRQKNEPQSKGASPDTTDPELHQLLVTCKISNLYDKLLKAGVTAEILWDLDEETLDELVGFNKIEKMRYQKAKKSQEDVADSAGTRGAYHSAPLPPRIQQYGYETRHQQPPYSLPYSGAATPYRRVPPTNTPYPRPGGGAAYQPYPTPDMSLATPYPPMYHTPGITGYAPYFLGRNQPNQNDENSGIITSEHKKIQCKIMSPIVAIGNPGSGKSTVLNAIAEKRLFRSGISFGSGLTNKLEIKQSNGRQFIDLPGVADAKYRNTAGEALTEVFRNGGRMKILFFFAQQAGRIVTQDVATMKLVLEAVPDIGRNYGIIVNMVSQDVLAKLSKTENWQSFITSLYYGIKDEFKHTNIIMLPHNSNLDGANNVLLDVAEIHPYLQQFVSFSVTDANITPGRVSSIPVDEFDQMTKQIKELEAELMSNKKAQEVEQEKLLRQLENAEKLKKNQQAEDLRRQKEEWQEIQKHNV